MAKFVFSDLQQLANVQGNRWRRALKCGCWPTQALPADHFLRSSTCWGGNARSQLQAGSQAIDHWTTPSTASARLVWPVVTTPPQIRRNRSENSDHRILQLVTLCRSHQRRNPAGDPLTTTRQTLHPRNGSPLGERLNSTITPRMQRVVERQKIRCGMGLGGNDSGVRN